LDSVSNKWREIGDLIKIIPATLDGYKSKNLGDEKECMRNVFEKWIEATSQEVRQR